MGLAPAAMLAMLTMSFANLAQAVALDYLQVAPTVERAALAFAFRQKGQHNVVNSRIDIIKANEH